MDPLDQRLRDAQEESHQEWYGFRRHFTGLTSAPNLSGAARRIRLIEFSDCTFDELPPSLQDCTGLRELTLRRCSIRRLPELLRELNRLRVLSIIECPLADFPSWLSEHLTIESISVQRTNIDVLHLPEGGFKRLVRLCASHNRLRRVPAGVGRLPRLRSLDLCGQPLDPHCTEAVVADSGIRDLSLAGCSLESIPSFVYELKQLERLDLSHNRIACIDDQLTRLDSLKHLDLTYNALTDIAGCLFDLPSCGRPMLKNNPLPEKLAAAARFWKQWERLKVEHQETRPTR